MTKLLLPAFAAALLAVPASAQTDWKNVIVRHLTTSRDFTIKVAEAMPEANYDFKLTPAQMSFGGQMVHLAQGFDYFLSAFSGGKPNPDKPKSNSKENVIAFVQSAFDGAIAKVAAMTPEQIQKTYQTEMGPYSGADLLLGMLDHTTHHRASAEMYLRAKGITPPEYRF